jgi:hypothetical protein
VICVYFPTPAAKKKERKKERKRERRKGGNGYTQYILQFLPIYQERSSSMVQMMKVKNVVQLLTALKKKTPTKRSSSLLATSWYHQYQTTAVT